MINIQIDFEIGDKVKIRELNTTGRVISVWIGSPGAQYEIRYFIDGKIQKEYFYKDEISVV